MHIIKASDHKHAFCSVSAGLEDGCLLVGRFDIWKRAVWERKHTIGQLKWAFSVFILHREHVLSNSHCEFWTPVMEKGLNVGRILKVSVTARHFVFIVTFFFYFPLLVYSCWGTWNVWDRWGVFSLFMLIASI